MLFACVNDYGDYLADDGNKTSYADLAFICYSADEANAFLNWAGHETDTHGFRVAAVRMRNGQYEPIE